MSVVTSCRDSLLTLSLFRLAHSVGEKQKPGSVFSSDRCHATVCDDPFEIEHHYPSQPGAAGRVR